MLISAPKRIPKRFWESVLDGTAVSNPTPNEPVIIRCLDTDGTYVFVCFRDTVVNTNIAGSMVHTYTIDPNGDLTLAHQANFVDPGGLFPEFNTHRAMLYKSNMLYVVFTGGWISYQVNANGSLTTLKTTTYRTGGRQDVDQATIAHGKYLVLATGWRDSVANTELSYVPILDGQVHGDRVKAFGAYSWNSGVWANGDKIYNLAQPTATKVNEITLSSSGVWSGLIIHNLPSSGSIAVVGDKLYYRAGGNTVFGHFPINPDGSLGTRVDDGVDWRTVVDDTSLYTPEANKRQISVGARKYRNNSNEVFTLR